MILWWVPPGLLLGAVLVLLMTQLFHAFWHNGRCRYVAVLLLTAAGVAAGQGWDALGLPALRFGQVNLVPGVLFAAALQPFGQRLTLRLP